MRGIRGLLVGPPCFKEMPVSRTVRPISVVFPMCEAFEPTLELFSWADDFFSHFFLANADINFHADIKYISGYIHHHIVVMFIRFQEGGTLFDT